MPNRLDRIADDENAASLGGRVGNRRVKRRGLDLLGLRFRDEHAHAMRIVPAGEVRRRGRRHAEDPPLSADLERALIELPGKRCAEALGEE